MNAFAVPRSLGAIVALVMAVLGLLFGLGGAATAAPAVLQGAPETHSATVSSRHHLPVSVTLPRYHGAVPLEAVLVTVRFDLARTLRVDNVDNDQQAFVDFNAIASFQAVEVMHPTAGLLVHAETFVPTIHTATPAGFDVTFPVQVISNVHATGMASGGNLDALFGGRGDLVLPISSPSIYYTQCSTECYTHESTDMVVTVEITYIPQAASP